METQLTRLLKMSHDVPDETIIAECIASTGYGTDSYDSESGECTHAAYANVDKVILNEAFWNNYESILSASLWSDFRLPWGFDSYRLTVTADGTKTFIEEKR